MVPRREADEAAPVGVREGVGVEALPAKSVDELLKFRPRHDLD